MTGYDPAAPPPAPPPPAPPPPPPAGPPPAPAARRSRPLWVYVVSLVAIVVVGAIVIKALEPPPPDPPCNPVFDVCSDPPPGGGDVPPTSSPQPTQEPGPTIPPGEPGVTPEPYIGGTTWTSSELGFQVVYNPDKWVVAEEGPTFFVLGSKNNLDVSAVFDGALASDLTVDAMIEVQLDFYGKTYTSIEEDDDPYKAILGAHIAYVDGVGRSYVATGKGTGGLPLAPLGLGILAATDGRVVVAFVMEVFNPDKLLDSETTRELYYRGWGDTLLKDFRWGP